MEITQVEDLDALASYHAVEVAAQDHDYVALPADPIEELVPLLSGKTAGELVQLFLGTHDGTPVGIVRVGVPTLDNLTAASLDLSVHPDHRGRGHGRALLGFGIEQVHAHGRRRIFMEVPSRADGTDGAAVPLMKEFGARPVLTDVRRLLDLRAHRINEPPPLPEGYRVMQWTDRAPDEIVEGVAYLMGRMTLDAPMGEMDYEPEKWDALRYRDDEAAAVARGRLRLATVAVHEASRTVAGLTDIGVNRSRPEIGYQWQTIVDPLHRGHRLGIALKSWNHWYLQERMPETNFLNTWNAASNRFMISVNEELGYQPVEQWTEYQLDL